MKFKKGEMWDDTKPAHKIEVRIEKWAVDEKTTGGAEGKGVPTEQGAGYNDSLYSGYYQKYLRRSLIKP
jgi:hypothetical protein